jgi:hypothetical protein
MNNLKIQGTVKQVMDLQKGEKNGKEWQKQDFVITTHEQYAKNICIQAFNKTTQYVDNLSMSDNVEVSFNVESREWESKWFTQVTAWKIEKINASNDSSNQNNTNYKEGKGYTPHAQKQPEITHNEVMKAMQMAGANVDLEPTDDLPF